MKKNIKLLLKNKKILLGIIIIALVIVIIISLILGNANKANKLSCTKNQEFVTGINLDETTIITIKDDKISRIIITKKINLDNYYQQFDTYRDAIFKHMSEAYNYLDKKSYTIEKTDDYIMAKIDTTKDGVILNNLEISKLSETSRDDLRINSSNNLESSSSTYKINDEYKTEELKKKLEGLGYKCKS